MNQTDDDKKASRSSISLDDNNNIIMKDQTKKNSEDVVSMKAGSSGTEGNNNDNDQNNDHGDERKPSAVPQHKSDNIMHRFPASTSSSEEKDSTTRQEEQPQQIIIVSVIETPQPSDVLFGRGRPYQAHSGNVRLHRIVDRHKDRYSQSRRFDKLAIVDQIVYEVKSKGDGGGAGRFLKRSENGEFWEEVTDDVAREKVAHALRGKIKQARESNNMNDPSLSTSSSAPKASPPLATVVATAVPQIDHNNIGLAAARTTNQQTMLQSRTQFPLSLMEQLVGPNQPENQMGANLGSNHQPANPLISAQLLLLQQQQQQQQLQHEQEQEQERLQQQLQQLLSQNPGILLAILSSRFAPGLVHSLANYETLALLQGVTTIGNPPRLASVPSPAPTIDLTQLLLARELENARTRLAIEQLLQGAMSSGENEQQQRRESDEKHTQG
jgi:hypothetical protein